MKSNRRDYYHCFQKKTNYISECQNCLLDIVHGMQFKILPHGVVFSSAALQTPRYMPLSFVPENKVSDARLAIIGTQFQC